MTTLILAVQFDFCRVMSCEPPRRLGCRQTGVRQLALAQDIDGYIKNSGVVPQEGLEPPTLSLRRTCSTS